MGVLIFATAVLFVFCIVLIVVSVHIQNSNEDLKSRNEILVAENIRLKEKLWESK